MGANRIIIFCILFISTLSTGYFKSLSPMDISKLPEACLSHVLSLTSPRDSCISSAVSMAFKSAVDSDTVWEKFLPSDYHDILNRTVGEIQFSSKQDLYFRLCDPLLIDGGRMSFQLEKSSGAKCIMISARELSIVQGDIPEHWEWITMPGARFKEVALLRHTCWLEIHGKIKSKMLTENTKYAVYLVYKLEEESTGLDCEQAVIVSIGADESEEHYVLLDGSNDSRGKPTHRYGKHILHRYGYIHILNDTRLPWMRNDGWLEIKIGKFFKSGHNKDEIYASLLGGLSAKSGLCVLGIEVRPNK